MPEKIGIVGCGLMGSGIAQVSAQKGYSVIVREANEDLLKKGLQKIQNSLDRDVQKNIISEKEKNETLNRIRGTIALEEMKDVDIVIEAITEDVRLKQELFTQLLPLLKPDALITTNTSSVPLATLASVFPPPKRAFFLGLHFFNPVPRMKLVELIRGMDTSDESIERGKKFSESLGKTVVLCKDTPAFIVNHLLVPYILEAIRMLENGVATAEDIDTAMQLGCGHPMGPLTLADFVGLDTTLHIADIMYEETRHPKFASPPLLRRLVALGYYGKKSGRGIYSYEKK